MAIYHLAVKPVQRSAGRSATAAAAYRAGVEITDERTGQVHDYTRRRGVVSAEITLPVGASPALADRAVLWNSAERSEKRKDACVAREYEVALPAELSPDQRADLVREFAQALASRHGVAVDAAIHLPDQAGDQRNHHAHILTTTRQAGPDGLGPKADIERAGRNRRADLEDTRALWEWLANQALERAGQGARVDHRSLAAQRAAALDAGDQERADELDRAPTPHLGPVPTADLRQARALQREPGTDRARLALATDRTNAERAVLRGQIRDLQAARERRREAAAWQAMPLAELRAAVGAAVADPMARVMGEVALLASAASKAQYEAGRAAEAGYLAQRAAERWAEEHGTRAWLHRAGWWSSQQAEDLQQAALQAAGRAEVAREAARRSAQELDAAIAAALPGAQRRHAVDLERQRRARQVLQEREQAAVLRAVRLRVIGALEGALGAGLAASSPGLRGVLYGYSRGGDTPEQRRDAALLRKDADQWFAQAERLLAAPAQAEHKESPRLRR